MKTEQSERAEEVWWRCLSSACRTAIACILVGAATLCGPATIKAQVAFPAFSYVTVILIITNAALGDTVRGCWQAVWATVQGVVPAMLWLSVIGPARLTATSTAVVVGVSGFFIALPECTHLVTKRIALGQVVIVYVIAYINGERTHPIMHPVRVGFSTAVGVFACLLALLLPYPQLASFEVKQNCKLYAENARERLKVLVKAFCGEESSSSQALILQAKSLTVRASKILQSIKSKQESMQWERLPFKFLKPFCMNPADKFQRLEMPLRGMDISLSCSSFPTSILDEQFKQNITLLEANLTQNLNQIKNSSPSDSLTVPESNPKHVIDFFRTIQDPPETKQDLPTYFFFFCLKLLNFQSKTILHKPKHENPVQKQEELTKNDQNGCFWAHYWPETLTKKRLIPALKCSLSLGFAVFFGLIYSKENGYWSGLPVAISLAAAREATFKVANVKAQGTVIGTVYGVIGCFVFERFVKIRILALLPWFIFTSFLQRSKLYGQAGGISAVIGAVLILGRRNFGAPSDFAIARIVETFIGLSCSIMVELLLHPTRAASLAKIQLSKSLSSLQSCIGSVDLRSSKGKISETQKNLKSEINQLKQFIEEAEVEPNFWFMPFHGACYSKLHGSLSKTADLMLFASYAINFMDQKIQRIDIDCKDVVDKLNGDVALSKKMICSALKCLEKICSISSLLTLGKDIEKNNKSYDVEMGKPGNPFGFDESETGKIISSFLGHSKELIEKIRFVDDEDDLRSQIVLSLGSLGFCMSSVMKETKEIERGIKELVQWENPTSHVNLSEISCKLYALYN